MILRPGIFYSCCQSTREQMYRHMMQSHSMTNVVCFSLKYWRGSRFWHWDCVYRLQPWYNGSLTESIVEFSLSIHPPRGSMQPCCEKGRSSFGLPRPSPHSKFIQPCNLSPRYRMWKAQSSYFLDPLQDNFNDWGLKLQWQPLYFLNSSATVFKLLYNQPATFKNR